MPKQEDGQAEVSRDRSTADVPLTREGGKGQIIKARKHSPQVVKDMKCENAGRT